MQAAPRRRGTTRKNAPSGSLCSRRWSSNISPRRKPESLGLSVSGAGWRRHHQEDETAGMAKPSSLARRAEFMGQRARAKPQSLLVGYRGSMPRRTLLRPPVDGEIFLLTATLIELHYVVMSSVTLCAVVDPSSAAFLLNAELAHKGMVTPEKSAPDSTFSTASCGFVTTPGGRQ